MYCEAVPLSGVPIPSLGALVKAVYYKFWAILSWLDTHQIPSSHLRFMFLLYDIFYIGRGFENALMYHLYGLVLVWGLASCFLL